MCRFPGTPLRYTLVILRNNMRLDDNRCITHALRLGHPVMIMLVVNFFDWARKGNGGFPSMGPARKHFLLEAYQDLERSVAAAGNRLHFEVSSSGGLEGQSLSRAVESVKTRLEGVGCSLAHVVTSRECGVYERRDVQRLRDYTRSLRVPLTQLWDRFLIDYEASPWGTAGDDDTAIRESVQCLPCQYTPFRRQAEARCPEIFDPKPLPRPAVIPALPDERLVGVSGDTPFPQAFADLAAARVELQVTGDEHLLRSKWMVGGETAGLAQLDHFIWKTESLATYKETRNRSLGREYSSKLSPWLGLGCVSARRVAAEVKRFEDSRVKNESTYWMLFELLWRDYLTLADLKAGRRFYQLDGLRNKRYWRKEDLNTNRAELQAWAEGTTGFPLVDANMRELHQTGYMSNRGRQNVASFLVYTLNLDWRLGAEYFEYALIDHDVALNWGNWMTIAAVGFQDRENRFNIVKQSKTYEPDGSFLRHWIPELRHISTDAIHTPWDVQVPAATPHAALCEKEKRKPKQRIALSSRPSHSAPRVANNRALGKAPVVAIPAPYSDPIRPGRTFFYEPSGPANGAISRVL